MASSKIIRKDPANGKEIEENDGCDLAVSCLECPFPKCKQEFNSKKAIRSLLDVLRPKALMMIFELLVERFKK